MTYIQFLTYFFPLLLVIFAFINAKFYKPHTFNENAYSLTQSKAIQGWAALVIMFHHMAQHTCAPWLKYPRLFGLAPFLNIGYVMVGIFFFASGFGLYKSVKSKKDYMKHFFSKRFIPLLYFYVIANVITFLITKHLSTYTWFVYAIAISYVGFFIAFKFIKNDHIAIIVTALFSLAYVYGTDFVLGYETYWFNSSLVFIFGILFAKYENKLMAILKKCFWVALPLLAATFILSFGKSLAMDAFLGSSQETYTDPVLKLETALMQTLAALTFTLFIVVLNLKVEFRNPLLNKMGGITLGFYLIHPIFCDIFCFVTPFPQYKKFLYYKSIPLYVLAVLITSLLATILFYWLFGLLKKICSKSKNKEA